MLSPSTAIDHRIKAARRDLAEIGVAGRWFAPHYAVPQDLAGGPDGADILDAPRGKRISQLLPGEGFAVVELSGDWAWGYSVHDHYVGYVAAGGLVPLSEGVRTSLPQIGAIDGADAAAIAERLTGMPYLWGARGIGGIDCSGLVQLSYGLTGIALPRDSDQQAALGTAQVPAELRRGDLLFFPDHVVMMTGLADAIHASGHHMSVMTEALSGIVARLGAPTGHYRP